MDITQFADIHTHTLPWHEGSVVNIDPTVTPELPAEGFFSVGVHPWHSAQYNEQIAQRLSDMAANERVIAIGETGIDALRGAPLDLQEQVFKDHVALSETLAKPLIIHAVKSFNRLIELRRELQPSQRWIVHGFRGKPQLARELLRHGFDLSFGEHFNPQAIAVIPVEHRFAETDDSTLDIQTIINRHNQC